MNGQLPHYDAIIRELTYAIRDLASAQEIATYRRGSPEGRHDNAVYRVTDEYNAVQLACSRLAGAFTTTRNRQDVLEKEVAVVEAAFAADAQRVVDKARLAHDGPPTVREMVKVPPPKRRAR